MASLASALTGTSTTTPSSNSQTSASSGSSSTTPTEEMFLNLLVAQIQNQDPLNPTDSAQFVSQLAQISELEQTIGIRSDIETYMGSQSSSSATNGTPSQTTSVPTQTGTTGQNTSAATNNIA